MSTYPIPSQYSSFGNTCPISGEDDEMDWAMTLKPVPWVVLEILKVLKSTNGIPIFGEICVLLSKRLNCLVFSVLLNTWGFNRGGKCGQCFFTIFSLSWWTKFLLTRLAWGHEHLPAFPETGISVPSRRSWILMPTLSRLGLQVTLVARPARGSCTETLCPVVLQNIWRLDVVVKPRCLRSWQSRGFSAPLIEIL